MSGQTKEKIVPCFSTNYATFSRNHKDWLARKQVNVF